MTTHRKTMLRTVAVVLAVLADWGAFGAVIPANRRADWSNVGVPGGIPTRTNIFANIKNAPYNARGDGVADDTAALRAAIGNCPEGRVVFIPAGTYRIQDISIEKGIILRGAGMGRTILVGGDIWVDRPSSVGTYDNALGKGVVANILSGATKGSTNITVSSSTYMQPGAYVMIAGEDPALANPQGYEGLWYSPCMGQVSKILSKVGNTITFDPPLFWNLPTRAVTKITYNDSFPNANYIQGFGIEDLTIDNNGSSYALWLLSVANSWVKNVEVTDYQTAGIRVWYAYRCEIRGSYVHDTRGNGSGGGYGILVEGKTTHCLIEDNIVNRVAGSIMLDDGSSCNVVAYNYVHDNKYYEPNWMVVDFSNHSAHPMLNLWEGNIGHMFYADFIHGSGSHNILYRNRLKGWKSDTVTRQNFAAAFDAGNYHNSVAGNVLGTAGKTTVYEVTPPGFDKTVAYALGYSGGGGYDAQTKQTLYRHGNFDFANGRTLWDPSNTDTNLPSSLYLTTKPAWWGSLRWPPIGPDLLPMVTQLPAEVRYLTMQGGNVNLPPQPVASALPTSGMPPLVVQFSSAGSVDPEGAPLTFTWAFGDGTPNSTLPNPSHTYSTESTYVARLTVSDGTNSANSSDLIIRVGNQAPIVTASANPSSGVVPLTVNFSSSGSADPEGSPLTYSWTFGDGGTSTEANPTYTYQSIGSFDVRLTVSDGVKASTASNLVISVRDPANTLVAEYGFEEGAGNSVSDTSGTGNSGVVSGATWTTGRYGNGLSFGPNARVNVPPSPTLNLGTGMTLEAWVRPTATLTGWRNIILREDNSGSIAYVLHGNSPPSQVPSWWGSFSPANVFALTTLPLNTWSHLAATYDGLTMRIYVNGVLVNSRAQAGRIADSTQPLTIGGNPAGDNWLGVIDEIRIYNRALSASEIQTDMNKPVAGARPDPPDDFQFLGSQ